MPRWSISLQLNQFYKDNRCLGEIDTSYDGIEIIDADNRDQSVLSFIRKGKKDEMLVCVFNMAPVERKDFRLVYLLQVFTKKFGIQN